MNLDFSTQIFQKTQISKFYSNPPNGRRVAKCRQTDRRTGRLMDRWTVMT